MGELVIVETLVQLVRSDQGRGPRRGICVKDKMKEWSLKEHQQKNNQTDLDLRRRLARLLIESDVSLKEPSVFGSERLIVPHQRDTLTYGSEAST